ncbi:MAG: autoinducer binding domain-containing protein [Burkholderiales bacterium]|nr:autoinducer binding domain-containing protein [Burkholderiales bacterium]
MKPSECSDDLFSLATVTSAPDYGTRLLDLLPQISSAANTADALTFFKHALRLIGADAGVFLSALREGADRTSYRSLLACDPLWVTEYTKVDQHEHDPWLRHAMHSTEPIRSSELAVRPDEEEFVRMSSRLGFSSALIVPAPSNANGSRIDVLCLGSHNLCFFDGHGYPKAQILAEMLVMALHRWLLRAMRNELLSQSRIRPDEIDLLRHQEAGHSSKTIGAALHVEAKTVDCRFQRLAAKLDVPDRRAAARIARLYGLL